MAEHRESKGPEGWRRDIVASAVVVLSVAGAGLWTLLWVLLAGISARQDWITLFSWVLPAWFIATILIILVLWWERRGWRGGG